MKILNKLKNEDIIECEDSNKIRVWKIL